MTPRSVAVNQVRRRRRTIPSVPPEPPRPEVAEPRYYCPACGMVRPRQGVWETEGGAVIRLHYLYRPGPWSDRQNDYQSGESLSRGTCPGGEIDLVKDRAP